MKDLVMTIKTHTESSKSELSSGTFDHFKVYTITDYFRTKIVGDADYFGPNWYQNSRRLFDTNYRDNPLAPILMIFGQN